MTQKILPLTETTNYILLALMEPGHGYLIMQRIEELSQSKVRMAAGTLYGAIENLVKLKYIKQIKSDDPRRKVYIITEEGKEILKHQYQRLVNLVEVTDQRLFNKGGSDESF